MRRLEWFGVRCLCIVLLGAGSTPPSAGAGYHVTSTGTSHSTGTLARPWSLQYALSHPRGVRPGDTIWVHGGVYPGSFVSSLKGTAQKPIVVRSAPNVRVTLQAQEPYCGVTLLIAGDHTWYWGLEITNVCMDTNTSNAAAVFVGGANNVRVKGNKLINCVLHDAPGNGIGDQLDAEETEVAGCVIYYNGRKTDNQNYAYGVYGQNGGPPKIYRDNIVMFNYGGYAFHMYTQSGTVDSIELRHNVIFGTGSGSANVMFSEASGCSGIVLDSNYFYGPSPTAPLYTERKKMIAPQLRGNQFVHGSVSLRASTEGRVFLGNTLVGSAPVITRSGGTPEFLGESALPGNVRKDWNPPSRRPRGSQVILRRNPFESTRAHLIIYNWDRADSADVDMRALAVDKEHLRVRDAQDYFGPLIQVQWKSREVLSLPLSREAVASPISVPAQRGRFVHTENGFAVFVLEWGSEAP